MASNIFEESVTQTVLSLKQCFSQAEHEWINPPKSVRLKNLPILDEALGGFRPHELTILCGPTGCGKTSLLANLSAQMLITREKHFVASVETGYADFVKRVFSVLMDTDLNTGDAIKPDAVKDVKDKYNFIIDSGDLYLSTVENRMDSDFLIKKLEYAIFCGCKVAMLDNLNFFLDVKSSSESIVEMDRVVHDVVMFCKRNPIHIILVMHPKKTDGGRVVSEFDIKGSSTAVQESHNVLLFNRPDPDSGLGDHYREIKIAKLRKRGANVGRILYFDGSKPRYKEQINKAQQKSLPTPSQPKQLTQRSFYDR